jgi:hypothetical protein
MSQRRLGITVWLATVALLATAASYSLAGNGISRIGAVGGVSIDAHGVVGAKIPEEAKLIREQYVKDFRPVPAELNAPVELRKISLRAIEEAVAKSQADITYKLPDEIRYLGGIQRIQYVFVYPEENDIVLAGPGEGWKVDENANHVGVTTGRPVLRLEDLMVALRTVDNARQGGITVSIDPSEEGRQRYAQLQRSIKQVTGETLVAIEKAFGPQQITISGVPDTSRFAIMMFCSDYHMKRIAMKLDPSPVKGLPSYVDMIKSSRAGAGSVMPRWWLACNYEPLGKSPDGLAYEIRGPGVKVLTEDELIGADGSVKGTGKVNANAQKWADLMTEKYDELSVKQPVFGELRNLMDLCVVAALIAKDDLLGKAKLEIPTLASENSKLGVVKWHAPKTVPTQVSATKHSGGTIVTASGGVEINSWEIANQTVESAAAAEVRSKSAGSGSLWWN